MDAGSSLVPNLTDRFQSVTYNEDSSIVYYPRKFLHLEGLHHVNVRDINSAKILHPQK